MVRILSKNPYSQPDPAPNGDGSAQEVTLDTLRPGEGGTVASIEAAPSVKMHLLELGFVPGSPVSFVMPTPFGDPYIYSLRGTCIALRKSQAWCIRIRK